MRVFINRFPVNGPWGGGNNFLVAFRSLSTRYGITVIDDVKDSPDAILVLGFSAENSRVDFYRALDIASRSKTKLLLRVNENDARKGTTGVDNTVWSMANLSHGVVFVSMWMQSYYANKYKTAPCRKMAVIHNGVDKSIFKKGEQNSTIEKLRIVTHHWSNNDMKGFDVYDAIDSYVNGVNDAVFEYIGRERGSFKSKNTIITPPKHGIELGNALGKATFSKNVYISGSRWDPGPNHVLEALACGFPTWVHVDGGGCVEFAGQDHVFTSIDDIINLLSTRDNRLFAQNAFAPITWDECIGHYCSFIRDVVNDA